MGRNDHLDQSIPGFFAKLFTLSSRYVLPLIENPTLASAGSLVSRILIIFCTVSLCSIPIKITNQEQFLSEFSLVIVSTLLITQRLWEASLTLLLPLYFIIASRVEKVQGKRWLLLSLTVLSIVMINLFRVIWMIGNPDKNALPWYLLITPFIGTILLWFIFAWMRFNEMGLHFFSRTPKLMADMQSFN